MIAAGGHDPDGSGSGERSARGGLFLHQAALGDFMLALHVVWGVRAAARLDRLTAVVRDDHLGLARLAGVDAVWSIESAGVHTLFGGCALDERLAQLVRRHEVIVSFLSGEDSACHRGLCSARAQPGRGSSGGVFSVDPRPAGAAVRAHITTQWLDALRGQGCPCPRRLDGAALRLRVPEQMIADLRSRLGLGTGRLAVLHPGSGAERKCWPLERFCRLAGRLRERRLRVCWVLGPAELERWSRQRLAVLSASGPVVCDLSSAEVAALAAGSCVYVGNDAGPTHVAAATGVPTVAVFGPTSPRRWRPLGARVRTCRGAGRRGDWPDVDEVIAVVGRALGT